MAFLRYATVFFVIAAAPISTSAAVFTDNFDTDTSSSYVGSDSFGTGGTFAVDQSDNNALLIQTAALNTFSVIRSGSSLGVGETFVVRALNGAGGATANSGNDALFIVLSTSTAQPDGTASFGFRLRVEEEQANIRFQQFSSLASGISNTSSAVPSIATTYWADRVSTTEFNFYAGQSFETRQLIVSGTLTASEASNNIFVGVEAFAENGDTYLFDDMAITTVPTPSSITLIAFGGLLITKRRHERIRKRGSGVSI